MPHNPKIPKRTKPANVLQGETPKTIFKDALDAVTVDLLSRPDQRIDLAAYAFQKATWADKPYVPGKDKSVDAQMLRTLDIEAVKGNGLPLSLELYDFVFAVSGISRIITHQVVRTRIGATYAQQCSGDKDWRHHDALVPRSIYADKPMYEAFKQNVIASKQLYADMLDTMQIPILDARRILPHCLETFIYVKFNLMSLMTFIKKRDCVQTQEPEMVIVARKMREAVLHQYPQFERLLQNECQHGTCFYTRSDRLVGTSMFLPDKDHDFDYNKANFIYNKTVREMIYDLPSVPEEYYVGSKKAK